VRQQSSTQVPPQLPLGWLLATHLSGVVNVLGLILTALGTYLTFKGNRAIRKAEAIAATARRNVLLQIAASEVSNLSNQAAILRIHVGFKNWDVSQHISVEIVSRLQEAKSAYQEIRGINRDRLAVAARSAIEIADYLHSCGDGEDDKAQKLQASCDYLALLLHDVYGALKLKEHEDKVL
jgi:hypothetical protein